jgi:hypothetical protein
MKKILMVILIIIGNIYTQTHEDVVILKNGGEVHGLIIEQKPNEYIKIQSGKNIFVYQMDEIEIIKKEVIHNNNENPRSNDFGSNTEKWYTYWALGVSTPNFSADYIELLEPFTTNFSETTICLDMLGFYRHLDKNTIIGFVIGANAHRIQGEIDGLFFYEQYNHYSYAGSYMKYLNTFGKGLFYRADIGLTTGHIVSEVPAIDINETNNVNGGLGVLFGGGYSFPFGGTRILLNTNYSIKELDGESQHNFNISLGGLF